MGEPPLTARYRDPFSCFDVLVLVVREVAIAFSSYHNQYNFKAIRRATLTNGICDKKRIIIIKNNNTYSIIIIVHI